MRLLNLFSRAGLAIDHHQFDEPLLDKATAAILKTRDGKLRAAVPHPLGSCIFINDLGRDEMHSVLRQHKEMMKQFPRNGEGLEAYVDSSDTGYTENNYDESVALEEAAHQAASANGLSKGLTNGIKEHVNGYVSGAGPHMNGELSGVAEIQKKHGLENGIANSLKGYSNETIA